MKQRPIENPQSEPTFDEHAAGVDEPGAHGAEHHQEFNWFHGMLGVKEGVEPSVLWRGPEQPIPFAATLLNTALLLGLIIKLARRPVAQGLSDRRQRIMRGIDDASAMQEQAKAELAMYRDKLANLDAEIERVRQEMRDTAEAERHRILEEARGRRARLEQEARVLIDQELKAVREQLTRSTAQAALSSARELLKTHATTDDHRRLCEQYLTTLRPGASLNAAPGRRSNPT